MPTSGLNSCGCWESAGLSSYLASRCEALTSGVGSIEFRQTWRTLVTQSGRRFSEHIARERPIGGSDCTGSQLTAWSTPSARDWKDRGAMSTERPPSKSAPSGRKRLDQLGRQALQAMPPKWVPCPCCEDFWCNIHQCHAHDCGCPDPGEGEADPYSLPGPNQQLSTSETGRGVVLNPCHARWLMGFPPTWDASAVMAMRSYRKRRRSS